MTTPAALLLAVALPGQPPVAALAVVFSVCAVVGVWAWRKWWRGER